MPSRMTNYISIRPEMQSGQPCIGNTRIPVEVVIRAWWYTTVSEEVICNNWGITPQTLRIACWYWGCYRRRTKIGHAWTDWAERNEGLMWLSEYEMVSLPSRQADA